MNTITTQGLSFEIYLYESKLFGLRVMDEHVKMERPPFSIVCREDGVDRLPPSLYLLIFLEPTHIANQYISSATCVCKNEVKLGLSEVFRLLCGIS